MENAQKPTIGQIERNLSQRIQQYYRQQLDHTPSKVTCQIFDHKIAIILEECVTPTEQLLVQEGQVELAQQVRSSIDEIMHQQLKELIEEVLEVTVEDLLSDSTLETGRIGLIAILSDSPDVRNPNAIPKNKQNKVSS
ncbi:conserved hypothetical protein [Gloeothece citriformis PCC 7424]|uniref:Na+-translocating membrane potential-generating system MpsC domain-containing protein n=1 Tax=Gloeothece citriformis (strain PCC 7424) TaxID=65393 RepID=B7KCK3_GLOC7|nr:DUF2294 domain-containing protein [Gloeothece citriformis]ACK71554.1 conserved hypothetical protein [Gloeothece citriformis PCC 7424]